MAHRGQVAETRAADFLIGQGLRVVARNWRCRMGEIDLIAEQGRTLVFVEVRSRGRTDFGGSAASITSIKQARIIAAARAYLSTLRHTPACRFDVVLFDGANSSPEWLQGAFDAG